MPAIAVSVPGFPGRTSDDCAEVAPEGDAVAVADGVGSAAMGSLGSHTAIAVVLGDLRTAVRQGASPTEVGKLLVSRYASLTESDRRVASTCLFAIDSGDRVVVGQAGDGLAGVLLSDGWVSLRSARGEWSNQTEALPRATVDCQEWQRGEVRAVFLATDGVSDDLVPGREADLVASLVELAAREGTAVLERRVEDWLVSWPTPRSNDDRSVGLLIPGIA